MGVCDTNHYYCNIHTNRVTHTPEQIGCLHASKPSPCLRDAHQQARTAVCMQLQLTAHLVCECGCVHVRARVVVMVVCNCNRLQLITNSYVIVILIVIDDNFV